MPIRIAFITFPCLHGSMHLVITASPCHLFTVFPCLRVDTLTGDRATEPPSCHLAHHHPVPPATHMLQPVLPWDQMRHCDTTVPPGAPSGAAPWHHSAIVPPVAPPCHLVRHRAIWCATVPPCIFAAAVH